MEEIANLFRKGSNLIKGDSKVAGMEYKVERFEAFIDDAERTAEAEGDIKTRVEELKEAYFRLEDAMDECMVREEQQPRDPGCVALLCGASDFIKTLMLGLRIDHENRVITGGVERLVIAVVGMGGAGKTTLAKKVFDSQKVIQYFDCRAWITVSVSYTIEGLLREMLRQFTRYDVTVGALLSCKDRNPIEWERFSQQLSSRLEYDFGGIQPIIGLSYDHLPYNLKSCLLYFGMYPQDYEIKSKRLIRQWIAEGFIKKVEGKTLEEAGERYLTQLINTSLVQVSSYGIDGKAKGCHLHDMTYDMILRRYDDSCFWKCITENDTPYLSEKTRRLSIQTISNDLKSIPEGPLVRSLLFFIKKGFSESVLRLILSKYKLLRVLDFENASARLSCFPENLGDLILLKYLSLRNTGIQSLPKSIGKLHSLETLDLRQTEVNEMLKEVTNLTKLRHLLGKRMPWTQLKDGIGGMTSLQTLSEVQIDDDEVEPIKKLGNLTQLRKFSLIDVREEQVSDLCSSISKMKYLEKLYIEAKSKDYDKLCDNLISKHFLYFCRSFL